MNDNDGRCDRHVGEAFPPRCEECEELQSKPARGGVRDVDSARAMRLVSAQISGDELMFAVTVQEILSDDYRLGLLELGSAINVLRSLSEDLAGAIVDVHGSEQGAQLVRQLLLQRAGAAGA